MKKLVCLLAAISVFAACGDEPEAPKPPEPGTLTVYFNTSITTERAALIQLTGPVPFGDIQTVPTDVTSYSTEVSTSVRVIVTGPLLNGALLRFPVPDVNKVKDYSATIIELADASNALRTSLAGYSLRVDKQ